ncbi:MAG: DUF47 family protein [Thioalkalispiraceae bacterium]|jgi:uncharacterized protein Yka (UPF0111/DUF47 family)
MGFITKFFLPKEVDFVAALQAQSRLSLAFIDALHKVYIDDNQSALPVIQDATDQASKIKDANMKELMDVFITPYDKESIYRLITQLDWVILSVKHLVTELEAYHISSLTDYEHILKILVNMANLLDNSVKELSSRKIKTIAKDIGQIHDLYDQVVRHCANAKVAVLENDDYRQIFMRYDVLMQLKEVAKRIRVTANTLEDMALKVV